MALIGFDRTTDPKKLIAAWRRRLQPLADADAALVAVNAAQRAATERHKAATRAVTAAAAALARGEATQQDVDRALEAEAQAERAADPRIFDEQRRAPRNVKSDHSGVLKEIEAEIAAFARERVDAIRHEMTAAIEQRIEAEIIRPLDALGGIATSYGAPIASAALNLRELGMLRTALPGCLHGLHSRGATLREEPAVLEPQRPPEPQRTQPVGIVERKYGPDR